MRTRTPTAAVVAALVALLALFALVGAACGADDEETPAAGDTTTTTALSADAHNDADVEFARMMIPHHRQAVEMAALAPGRAESPQITALAAQVQAAQDPEIERLTAWLEEWGEEVPAPAAGGSGAPEVPAAGGPSAGSGESPPAEAGHGTMSAESQAALEAATGGAFDRMFAELMIEHHEGAVAMAGDEVDGGLHAGAVALAESVVEAQESEIAEMETFLRQAP